MRTVLAVLGAAVVSQVIAVGIFVKLVSRRHSVNEEEYEVFFFNDELPEDLPHVSLTSNDFAIWEKEYTNEHP